MGFGDTQMDNIRSTSLSEDDAKVSHVKIAAAAQETIEGFHYTGLTVSDPSDVELTMPPTKPSWWEEASKLPYFFSHFKNQEEVDRFANFAELLFRNVRGVYFMRPSLSDPNALTVTVVVNEENIRHFRITRDQNRRYSCCNGRVKFQQIREVIHHHTDHGFLHHDETLRDLKLTNAILHQNIADFRKTERIAWPFDSNPTDTREIKRYIFEPKKELDEMDATTQQAARGRPPNITERPPVAPRPFPRSVTSRTTSSIDGYDNNEVYSEPIPHDTARHEDLIRRLQEEESKKFCHCGIPETDAIMPDGWIMHKNNEDGRIFFQNREEETAWDLPESVWQNLNGYQKNIISRYKESETRFSLS